MTWYAFTTTQLIERRAWDGLEKIGIVPARLELPHTYNSSNSRRRSVMRPLIPGYAIANVSGPIPWPLIRMIEWQGKQVIHNVLRSGGIPRSIPSDEVARLSAYLEERQDAGPGTLRPGARARVAITRFDSHETVVQRVLSASRCTVMMRLFGSDREVQTTVDKLKEAG